MVRFATGLLLLGPRGQPSLLICRPLREPTRADNMIVDYGDVLHGYPVDIQGRVDVGTAEEPSTSSVKRLEQPVCLVALVRVSTAP